MNHKRLDKNPDTPYSNPMGTLFDSCFNLIMPQKLSTKDILIAVMGMTGTGKSTFTSLVTGKRMEIGHNLQSCTQEIEVASVQWGQQTVHFIDTPGFDDTDRTDREVLELLAVWLEASYNKNMRFSGIIYLHRITDDRVTGSAIRNLRMFNELCGRSNMGNVLLVTNMWQKVPLEEGERRERELLETGKFWGTMIKYGARSARHDGTRESANKIALDLVKKAPIVLQLQKELHDGKNIGQTAAGEAVQVELKALAAQHAEEMANLKREIEELRAESASTELIEDFFKFREELEEKMKKVAADEKALSDQRNHALERKVAELEKQLEQKGRCAIS